VLVQHLLQKRHRPHRFDDRCAAFDGLDHYAETMVRPPMDSCVPYQGA
jgi:hypothetical protein